MPCILYPICWISHKQNISSTQYLARETFQFPDGLPICVGESDSAMATAPNERAIGFIPLLYTALRPFRRAPRRTPLSPFGAPICPLGPAGSNRVSIAPGTRLPSLVLGFRRFATAQTHLQPHPTAVAVPGGRDAPLLAAQQRRDIVISRYLGFEIFRF